MANKSNLVPLVSVVLSFRNEEGVIPELINRLQKVFRALAVRYEIIFVNDDSTDDSLPLLIQKRKEDPAIKVLNMSRRFGVSECALAGMEYAKGDAVIIMDADLQDPPEVIPKLIEQWHQGADVVYTVRVSREGEPAYKLFLTKLAYKAIRKISEIDLPENAGDFKLISRHVLNELLKLKGEKEPYLRGLVTWMGFRQVPVYYDREARYAGESHFPIFRSKSPLKTFFAGLTSFSLFPLYLLLLFGVLLCFLAVLTGVAWAMQAFGKLDLPNWWFLVVLVLFLFGIQFVGLGVVGFYLGKVYHVVRGRPNYIVASQLGFDETKAE